MLLKSLLLSGAMAVSAVLAADTTSLNATITSTTSIEIASGCSFSRTLTATAQSDLDAIGSCEAIRGDILIQGDALNVASIASVRAIYGDLRIFNATQLDTFTASELTTVTGTFSLEQLTILSTLNVQALSSVGAINFVTLPALTSINFGASSITDTESIYISDTELESLNGFAVTEVEVFNVNNNRNLATLNSDLQSVSSALEVSYNSDELEATFDSLIWANNITLRDISSISFANLSTVNASFGVISTELESLNVDNLSTIGGTFIVSNNDDLADLSFPELTTVGGGFVITNNSELHNVTGFDSLRSVAGAVLITGDIDEASFDSLRTVRGGFRVESEGDLNCRDFNSLDSRGVIQGDNYVCRGASTSTSATGSTRSSSRSSSSSSATSTGSSASDSNESSSSSANGAAATGVTFLGSVAAFVLAFL